MSILPQNQADQREFWNGPIGETWVREQRRLDRAFAPFTQALVGAVAARPGQAILDIGCGCGELALELAAAVGPGGRVTAVDLSRPMLVEASAREARLRAEGAALAPITWAEADASALSFDARFDHVVSRFGVMFFDDPVAAFRHLRGALAPEGRLAALCWQDVSQNGWTALPMAAIVARFGPLEPTPPFAPGPFAFADAERTCAILRQAGFGEATAEPVVGTTTTGIAGPDISALDDAVVYSTAIGLVPRYVRDFPERRAAVHEAVREALAPYAAGERVELPAACWIYRASAA